MTWSKSAATPSDRMSLGKQLRVFPDASGLLVCFAVSLRNMALFVKSHNMASSSDKQMVGRVSGYVGVVPPKVACV